VKFKVSMRIKVHCFNEIGELGEWSFRNHL
jgi:hypothetical protein